MSAASSTNHETPVSQYFPPFASSPELEAEADERISHYSESKRSAVLPLLHIVQHKFGFISSEAIDWVAAKLDLEPIKVLEVVTFYPGFPSVCAWEISHSRLPHFIVCLGRQCRVDGRSLQRVRDRSHSSGSASSSDQRFTLR